MMVSQMSRRCTVGYETKVILIAIAEIISKAENVEEVYKAVAEMANAEGVILKPYEEKKKDK